MKILIPHALAYSVEGQQFKPDANGVYDIPDALIPKMNEPWQAAPDQGGEAKKDAKEEPKKEEPKKDAKNEPPHPASHR